MNAWSFGVATLALAAANVAYGFSGAPTVDFSKGSGGWQGIVSGVEDIPGVGTWIDASTGNGAPAMRSVLIESFDVQWSNFGSSMTGDYTKVPGIRFSFDINATSISDVFSETEVQRDVVIELRSTSISTPWGAPYVSVWTKVGTIGAGMGGGRHLPQLLATRPRQDCLAAGSVKAAKRWIRRFRQV